MNNGLAVTQDSYLTDTVLRYQDERHSSGAKCTLLLCLCRHVESSTKCLPELIYPFSDKLFFCPCDFPEWFVLFPSIPGGEVWLVLSSGFFVGG